MAESDTPQVSQKGFVNPGTPAIPTLPSVKEVAMLSKVIETPQNVQPQTADSNTPSDSVTVETAPPASEMPVDSENVNPDMEVQPTETATEDFATCWKELFDELFANDPLIHHVLKDEIPLYENDIIYITLKNNIQKEQFEMRKTSILEYWRTHYKLNVEDIEFNVDEDKKVKAVIINDEDRFNNMKAVNDQLLEFLNALNFRMKQ